MIWLVCAVTALYWLGIGLKYYINRSERRKARRKEIANKMIHSLFDAVDWVRTKLFHRNLFSPRQEDQVVRMLAAHNVRAAFVTDPKGKRRLMYHQDDRANMDAFVEKAKQLT